MTLKVWLHSLAAAAITGAATGFSLCNLDPTHFNMGTGLKPLVAMISIQSVGAVMALLKKSPLPDSISSPSSK